MEPIHRDDLPMDVAEEMVKKLQELHPGCKIVFMGDQPGGVPPEMQADLDQFAQAQQRVGRNRQWATRNTRGEYLLGGCSAAVGAGWR